MFVGRSCQNCLLSFSMPQSSPTLSTFPPRCAKICYVRFELIPHTPLITMLVLTMIHCMSILMVIMRHMMNNKPAFRSSFYVFSTFFIFITVSILILISFSFGNFCAGFFLVHFCRITFLFLILFMLVCVCVCTSGM